MRTRSSLKLFNRLSRYQINWIYFGIFDPVCPCKCIACPIHPLYGHFADMYSCLWAATRAGNRCRREGNWAWNRLWCRKEGFCGWGWWNVNNRNPPFSLSLSLSPHKKTLKEIGDKRNKETGGGVHWHFYTGKMPRFV